MTTQDEFFSGYETSVQIYQTIMAAIHTLGTVEVRITKSQITFLRRKAFAWVWIPGKYLRGKTAPLVLSVALKRKDGSRRWKQIVEPKTGIFMHHLELFSSEDINDEVRAWLQESWDTIG
jgi:hypothetical protein